MLNFIKNSKLKVFLFCYYANKNRILKVLFKFEQKFTDKYYLVAKQNFDDNVTSTLEPV